MGGRKLRFDQWKNYECKRWPTQPLLSADAPATTSLSELVVHVLLSVFTSSMLSDASAVCLRAEANPIRKNSLNWMQLNNDHNPDALYFLQGALHTS